MPVSVCWLRVSFCCIFFLCLCCYRNFFFRWIKLINALKLCIQCQSFHCSTTLNATPTDDLPTTPPVNPALQICCDRHGVSDKSTTKYWQKNIAKLLETTEQTGNIYPHTADIDNCKKGKASPYSTAERRVPQLIPVLGSQHAGDVSHKPGGRMPLLSTRPAVTPATLKRAATNCATWWTEARWVWTVCLSLLPDSIDCDLIPSPSAPESSTITTRLPSHP